MPWQALQASWRLHGDRWLLGMAALGLAASFANPGLTMSRPRFDHVIVFDVTQSMNVTDVQLDGKPLTRLALAKHAVRESLLALPCGSKVGWAIFTEYRSYLLIEPIEVCANLGELRSTLAEIDMRMAWAGDSEIAKGLHSGIELAKLLPDTPSLVFVTDGQEAPPLSPRFRPPYEDRPGDVPGLIVGVGGDVPVPIPKSDPQGHPLGFWRADEVMQTDPRSQARGAGADGETPADDAVMAVAPALGATPGIEHLSSLREGYLRLLAREHGMAFQRLQTTAGLIAAMMAPVLAKPVPVRIDARVVLASLALCALLVRHLAPLLGRARALRARSSRRPSRKV
jgi:mxaL protein